MPSGAGCGHRCWRWATARWGSGRHCGTCSRRPGSSGAGSTSRRMCLRRCRSAAHPGAIKAMQVIYNAEDIDHARVAVKALKNDYGTKFPKAVEKITSELDVLLEFYNYPADHWVHLRTTNPIESTFSTVRLRTKVTK